jgi:hypothetical protein
MFCHCFKGNKLQDGADRIFGVRRAVSEDADCLLQFFRIRVLNARVSHFLPVKDASEGLLRDSDIFRRHARNHEDAKPGRKDVPFEQTSGKSVQQRYEMTHVVSSFPASSNPHEP